MKRGNVYTLTARLPHENHRARAREQPTRARAVLCWIECCEAKPKHVVVTVPDRDDAVQRQGDVWIVALEKGDWHAFSDRDVYLSRNNDYTMIASNQTVKGDPPVMMPLAQDLRRARERALEARVSPDLAKVRALGAGADTLAKSLVSMKVRNRLRLVSRELAKAAAELSVDSGAIVALSDCAAAECPAAVEGEAQPRGTDSLVPLEPAA